MYEVYLSGSISIESVCMSGCVWGLPGWVGVYGVCLRLGVWVCGGPAWVCVYVLYSLYLSFSISIESVCMSGCVWGLPE